MQMSPFEGTKTWIPRNQQDSTHAWWWHVCLLFFAVLHPNWNDENHDLNISQSISIYLNWLVLFGRNVEILKYEADTDVDNYVDKLQWATSEGNPPAQLQHEPWRSSSTAFRTRRQGVSNRLILLSVMRPDCRWIDFAGNLMGEFGFLQKLIAKYSFWMLLAQSFP